MNTYYFDMDGVIANFHKAYATNKMVALSRATMAALEPFEDNIRLVRNLIHAGERVYILTKAANASAREGKLDWLAKYLPEVTEETVICIVGHGTKADYIREEGILIDDDPKNTRPWEKAGHKAILLKVKGEPIAL